MWAELGYVYNTYVFMYLYVPISKAINRPPSQGS
jgi:hypothetical protein